MEGGTTQIERRIVLREGVAQYKEDGDFKGSIDILLLLRKRDDGGVDFLREALGALVEGMMEAEVSVRAGASYGERTPDQKKGRSWSWDALTGAIELCIPIYDGADDPVAINYRLGDIP